MKTKPGDVLGARFGSLTVVGVSSKLNGKTAMLCDCDCGAKTEATIGHLVGGRRLSCGCRKGGNPKHGMRYSRVYSIWCDMLKRCYNPRSVSYRYYGARGVTVCDRWRVFQNFLGDMGEPGANMSIDRIDVNGNYEPGNCRWATADEQARNRTDTTLYSYGGGTYTLPKLCAIVGVNYRTMRNRLFRSHMPLEVALNFHK